MKKYIYMAVAAIAALSSCSSDNDVIMEETAKQPLKFTASMEGATTRATFDSENKCASWEVNDQILIMANTQTTFYTYKAETAGLTTTFIPWYAQYVVPEAASYEAYFGCTILYGTPQKPCIPWTLYETWAEGKFNMPMYATSTTRDFQFKNLCGVLKIKVTNEQITAVKSIKLSSANKAIAGSFTVDANNAAVLDDPDDITSGARTIIYNSAVPTTAEGTVFYVAVPAQTYRELNIALNDGNGSIKNMTTKAATDITVERNKIYPITFNATSYAASFEKGDPRMGETAFSGFESSTLTASNADVSVSLALTGDRGMDPEWNEMGGIDMAMRDSKLTITVTPETGVTVSGIEYLYSGGNNKVTKTGPGPWQFDVKNNKVYDGDTELHSTFSGFYGIVVNYTKE